MSVFLKEITRNYSEITTEKNSFLKYLSETT